MRERLAGGRTNRVWRVEWRGEDAVLKFYPQGAETPLFRNDPQAEWDALSALRGTGLASEPLKFGGDRMVYRHVAGAVGKASAEQVGRALRRLHSIPLPRDWPMAATSTDAILAHGDLMLAECDEQNLAAFRPNITNIPLPGRAFLHGDPVPGNVVATNKGAVLIDWQCPAVGDPVHDLFLAASPGMVAVYGGGFGVEALLEAYGCSAVAERYWAAAPALHWRMAVYGQWKSERGDPAYGLVRDAEVAALHR